MKLQKIDKDWLPFVRKVQHRLYKLGWLPEETRQPDAELVDAISRALRLIPKGNTKHSGSSAGEDG